MCCQPLWALAPPVISRTNTQDKSVSETRVQHLPPVPKELTWVIGKGWKNETSSAHTNLPCVSHTTLVYSAGTQSGRLQKKRQLDSLPCTQCTSALSLPWHSTIVFAVLPCIILVVIASFSLQYPNVWKATKKINSAFDVIFKKQPPPPSGIFHFQKWFWYINNT